jgi:hypothetical protein
MLVGMQLTISSYGLLLENLVDCDTNFILDFKSKVKTERYWSTLYQSNTSSNFPRESNVSHVMPTAILKNDEKQAMGNSADVEESALLQKP